MNRRMLSPELLLGKAETAYTSARALFDLGDFDSAANRAYYAMFNAARAALIISNAPIKDDIGRTHSGLIGAFGEHLVTGGRIPKEIGKLLNRAHEIRLLADYMDGSVEAEVAEQIINQAGKFIDAIKVELWANH